MVHLSDSDIDFFDIVAEILKGYILALYFVYNLPRLYT